MLAEEPNLLRPEPVWLRDDRTRDRLMEQIDVGSGQLRMATVRTALDLHVMQDDVAKTPNLVSDVSVSVRGLGARRILDSTSSRESSSS